MKTSNSGMSAHQQTVFLDLEAKRSPEEVGGWEHIRKMGLGIAVTLEMPSGVLRIFEENHVDDLVEQLNQALCILGYNCDHFHFPLLRGLVGRKLNPKRTFDLLVAFLKAAGHRTTQQSLMVGTFGVGRSVGRTELMNWSKQRDKVKVVECLCQNVLDLELLYRRVKRTGAVFYVGLGGKRVRVRLEDLCES